MRKLTVLSILFVLAAFVYAGPAQAQATRTWVSGVGDDANPCSRTAPCKTFAGAISKTATNGEINVLDPGGFGGVTITKPITISSEGFEAGVLVSGSNGIIVNVPNATDQVVLRGLDIEGLLTGLSGITVLTGGSVSVEKCTINHFTISGINFAPTVGNSQLFVTDTIIRGNGNVGASTGQAIFVAPTATAEATLSNVRMYNNVAGLKTQGSSTTSVDHSVAASNGFAGFAATSPAVLNIDHTASTSNGTGVVCNSGATVRIGNMNIAGNPSAVGGSGTCSTYKNNDIDVPGLTLTPITQQ